MERPFKKLDENGTVTQFCEDHNECMFDTHDCDQEAHCNNTDGSYHCFGFSTIYRKFEFLSTHRKFSESIQADKSTCMEGYIGNGWMCSIPDS